MTLSERVARRFLADQIANPREALEKFNRRVDDFCKYEVDAVRDLPKLKAYVAEHIRALQAGGSKDDFAKARGMSDELTKTSRERQNIAYELRTGIWFDMTQAPGRLLFWAIMQQFLLPPALRKSIEKAAKFWAKSSVRAPKIKAMRGTYDADVEYLEAYLAIGGELRKQAMNAQAAITKGQAHSDPAVAAKTKIHVGSFDVVNTGGFDDEMMKRVAEVVGKAEQALTAHGLGKICYGDVLVSKSIHRANTAAFYILASDEMFVRADLPVNEETVLTVCHELAHRLQHKFLASKTRDIDSLYQQLRNHSILSDTPLPKFGEEVVYEGKKMKVIDTDYRRRSVKIQEAEPVCFACGKPVEGHQPDAEHKAPILRRVVYTMPATIFYKLKGQEVARDPMDFITAYAKSGGPNENFAEMVSYYCLNKLPKNQTDLLEPILL